MIRLIIYLILIFGISLSVIHAQIDIDALNDVDVDAPPRTGWIKKSQQYQTDDDIDNNIDNFDSNNNNNKYNDNNKYNNDNSKDRNRNTQYTIDYDYDDDNEALSHDHQQPHTSRYNRKEESEFKELKEKTAVKAKTQFELMMEEEEKAFNELGVLELMMRQIKRDFGTVTAILGFITPPQVKDILSKLWNDNKKSILGIIYGAAIPFSKVLAKYSKICGHALLNLGNKIELIHEDL